MGCDDMTCLSEASVISSPEASLAPCRGAKARTDSCEGLQKKLRWPLPELPGARARTDSYTGLPSFAGRPHSLFVDMERSVRIVSKRNVAVRKVTRLSKIDENNVVVISESPTWPLVSSELVLPPKAGAAARGLSEIPTLKAKRRSKPGVDRPASCEEQCPACVVGVMKLVFAGRSAAPGKSAAVAKAASKTGGPLRKALEAGDNGKESQIHSFNTLVVTR